MEQAKEFVEHWLESLSAVQRDSAEVRHLVNNVVWAARTKGFTKAQMEAELGSDIYDFVHANICRQKK
jgi:hypothetical protein